MIVPVRRIPDAERRGVDVGVKASAEELAETITESTYHITYLAVVPRLALL
jgi:hypothetical protein